MMHRSVGLSLQELATPCFLVNEEKLERNARRFLALVEDLRRAGHARLALRPHVKTHKTIEGAHVQIFGAWDESKAKERAQSPEAKVCVSTVGEAAFFVEQGGFQDVLLAVPIGKAKLRRCLELKKATRRFVLLVDHVQQLEALEEFFTASSDTQQWSVFVQVDCGGHRCGVSVKSPTAVELAMRVLQSHAARLDGFYTHGGHSYHQVDNEGLQSAAKEERLEILAFVLQFLEQLDDATLRKRLAHSLEISIGSTPSLCRLQSADVLTLKSDAFEELSVSVTELHPGNYIFYDVMQAQLASCSFEDCAGTVLASVLSCYPHRNEVLLDCGALALSKDTSAEHVLAPSAPQAITEWGQVVGHPDTQLIGLTQELGVLRCKTEEALKRLSIGTVVQVVPNHSCLTAACFPEVHCYGADGKVSETWTTAPRRWI